MYRSVYFSVCLRGGGGGIRHFRHLERSHLLLLWGIVYKVNITLLLYILLNRVNIH